jgi:hypothetical protein
VQRKAVEGMAGIIRVYTECELLPAGKGSEKEKSQFNLSGFLNIWKVSV